MKVFCYIDNGVTSWLFSVSAISGYSHSVFYFLPEAVLFEYGQEAYPRVGIEALITLFRL